MYIHITHKEHNFQYHYETIWRICYGFAILTFKKHIGKKYGCN